MTVVSSRPVLTQGRRTRGRVARSALAVIAAGLAVVCLLQGLSYPGFPFWLAGWGVVAAATAVALTLASGARALAVGHGGLRAGVVLTVVSLILVSGVMVAQADDGARLKSRWAGSQAAFEAELSTAGTPAPVGTFDQDGYFASYPGACPTRIGKFHIAECRSIDGGYLFLQAPGALTDDSGIIYLPQSLQLASQVWGTEPLTSLGGPWWSWTCYC